MTREEAKALLPIIQAYAEGKTIQTKIKTDSTGLAEEWIDVINPDLDGSPGCYRIKPEPTYRPFKDADECWQEMRKHQPFGWLQDKACKVFKLYAISIDNDGIMIAEYDNGTSLESFKALCSNYTFADGEPFGIKEEQ